jgi:hypothetical protein
MKDIGLQDYMRCMTYTRNTRKQGYDPNQSINQIHMRLTYPINYHVSIRSNTNKQKNSQYWTQLLHFLHCCFLKGHFRWT